MTVYENIGKWDPSACKNYFAPDTKADSCVNCGWPEFEHRIKITVERKEHWLKTKGNGEIDDLTLEEKVDLLIDKFDELQDAFRELRDGISNLSLPGTGFGIEELDPEDFS